MKKIKLFLFAFVLVLSFSGYIFANTEMDMYNGVYYYVIDSNDEDTTVTLSISNYSSYLLKYYYPGLEDWQVADSGSTVDIPTENSKGIVYWILEDDSGNKYDDAHLTFQGDTGNYYHTVIINWLNIPTGFNITIETAHGDDAVAPAPIPPSAWLLGIGFAGLLLIRRRKEA